MNHDYELMYNLGISLLFNKQPISAFECLYKVVDQYNQNCRLWLRLAECCIMCYRHSLTNDQDSNQFIKFNSTSSGNEKIFKLSEKIKCIKKSFGNGFHHKIQVGSFITPDNPNVSITLNDFSKSDDEMLLSKMMTLDFAYMCLKNALNLVPSNQQIFANQSNFDPSLNQLRSASSSRLGQQNSENLDDGINDSADLDYVFVTSTKISDEQSSEMSPNSSKQLKRQQNQLQQRLFNCVWPSKPINIAELQNLRSSILVSLSYVSLCLKDYSNTVKYCNTLLSNQDLLNSKYPVSKGNK